MFDEKNILARLANGEDAGVIANEFAAFLNQALETQRQAVQKQKIEARKNALAEEFADVLFEYMSIELPGLADAIAEEDVDLVSIARQSMDSVAAAFRGMFNECDCCGQNEPTGSQVVIQEIKSGEPSKTRVVTGTDADTIIDNFLKKFGL